MPGVASELGNRLRGLMALRVLVLTILGGTLLVLGPGPPLAFDQPTARFVLSILAVTYALSIGYAVLYRRLSTRPSFAAIQIAGDLVVWTLFVYATGGPSSGFSFLYGLSVLGAAILLGRMAAFAAAGGSAVLLAALAAAEASGAVRPLSDQLHVFSIFAAGEVTYGVFANAASFLAVALLGGYLAERLRLARGATERAERVAGDVVRSMRDGLLTLDPAGRIEGTNPAALAILGRESVAVLHTPVAEVLPQLAATLFTERTRGEDSCRRPDGPTVPVAFSWSPLSDDRGERLGTLVLLEDLGELRAMREELARAERLAALGRLAAALAHEIRNPLGGILGSIDLLASTATLGADEKRLCEIVRRETTRLSALVGDMLDFARPRTPSPEALDLVSLCNEVAVAFRASLPPEPAPPRLAVETPDRIPATLDPAQIRQVVWNLLRNAAQASPGGADIALRARPDGDATVIVEVSDRGPGVPPEERQRIFDLFYSTRLQGTGIGLPLVRQIVAAHGGSIEVDDTPGGGATFRVRLPAAVKAGPSKAPPPPS